MKDVKEHLHDKKVTTSPNEYPAVSRLCVPTINPHARSSRVRSTMNISRNKIQVDRTAATVKMTLTMSHTHMKIEIAWLNSGVGAPEAGSV